MYDGELDQLGHFVEHARRLDHCRRQLEGQGLACHGALV